MCFLFSFVYTFSCVFVLSFDLSLKKCIKLTSTRENFQVRKWIYMMWILYRPQDEVNKKVKVQPSFWMVWKIIYRRREYIIDFNNVTNIKLWFNECWMVRKIFYGTFFTKYCLYFCALNPTKFAIKIPWFYDLEFFIIWRYTASFLLHKMI